MERRAGVGSRWSENNKSCLQKGDATERRGVGRGAKQDGDADFGGKSRRESRKRKGEHRRRLLCLSACERFLSSPSPGGVAQP